MYEYFVIFMMAQCMTARGTGALFAPHFPATHIGRSVSNSTEIPPQGYHSVPHYDISQKLCVYGLTLSPI
jgi:hypothetical protein